MTDRETIAVYDARARDYADRFRATRADRNLRDFMATLPAGARVLDLGCGPGFAAQFMAEAGHTVDAWDASAQMVALAARTPGVAARQAVFDDLTAVAAYDGIWANFSLLHAPRDRMNAHLTAIARALTPGGSFHIGLKTGDGAARDGLGRAYTYYTIPDLRRRLTDAGLEVVAETTGQEAGLAGTVDPWVVLLARKNA